MNVSVLLTTVALAAAPSLEQSPPTYPSSPWVAAAAPAQNPTYEEMPTVVGPGTPAYTSPGWIDGSPTLYDPFLGQPAYVSASPYGYGGWYAAYESVFLKPHFSSDAAYDFRGLPANASHTMVQDFVWDLEHSPRVWVGYAGPDDLGFQVRYFQFDHSTTARSATDSGAGMFEAEFHHDGGPELDVNTADGEALAARHDLEIHALDFEGTWHKILSRGSVTVTAGVRYVSMDQDYLAEVIPAAGPITETLVVHHDFKGVGPTISVFGRRRVGSSNLGVFAMGRLSALYGDRSLDIVEFDPAGIDAFSQSGDDIIPVTELQMGVDWTRLVWGNTRLFLRTALEGQIWFDAGTGMASTGSRHVTSPQDGNLGLFGFVVGGGLTY